MLDNIVTEACMAAMPIEILADAKVNNKCKKHSEDNFEINTTNIINHTVAPVTKPNKTKTILNWLKNNTTSNTTQTVNTNTNNKKTKSDSREINSGHHNRFDKTNQQRYNDCTCPKAKQQNNTSNKKDTTPTRTTTAHKDDDTLREFRGVQTLKHFWNKRITANRESALRVKGSKHQFTKSVSCLVNTINNIGEPPPSALSLSPPPLSEKELLLKARKLRAFSLHDCSRNSPDFDEISLSDIDIQKHLEKDNFYKYKTAEQALKLRELSEHSTHRKLSNGIILPVGQKLERFDWLKRQEKFSRKKSIELVLSPAFEIRNNTNISDNRQQFISVISVVNNNIIINESKMYNQKSQEDMSTSGFLPTAVSQKTTEIAKSKKQSSKTSTAILTPTNSLQHAVSRRRETTRKDSLKNSTGSTSISRDSSTASLAHSSNSVKSVVKRNSSARKYSFKTHTRTYHVPRKMHTNKDTVGGSTAIVANQPNSLVAKLTQQFNEIIQKDKTLLDEIKRKNGVIMTHKGHVYKVVDTSALNRNQSPTVSRNGSSSQEANAQQVSQRTASSTVQRNIKKFESELRGLKPKVPLKSLQVLRKSNELVINKTTTNIRPNLNRLNNNNKENETKAEIKPQTLSLPSTLEMVQEEAKTPVYSNNLQDLKPANKFEEVCHEAELSGTASAENNFQQDEFMSVFPPKRDSAIYKINRRIRKDNTEAATREEYSESLNERQNSVNEITKELDDDKNETKADENVQQSEDKECKANSSNDDDNQQNQIVQNPLITESEISDESRLNDSNKQPTASTMATTIDNSMENCSSSPEPQQNDEKANQTKHKYKTEISYTNIPNNADKQPSSSLIDHDPSLSICEQSETDSKTIDNAAENSTSPEPLEDDEKKKRKHKYAKIYEKLRFFTPFAHTNKKQKLTSSLSPIITDIRSKAETITPALTINVNIAKLYENTGVLTSVLCENPKLLNSGEYTPMNSPTPKQMFDTADDVYSIMYNPEAKLLDALEQVDKKLQDLSNENDTILESDDYGHAVKPNSSFLHQTKDTVTTTPSAVIQAVNVTLVNAIEGEQMIMEQKEIQQETVTEQHENKIEADFPTVRTTAEEEPLYEPICVDKIIEIKTEQTHVCNTDNNCDAPEEDIYQTVEEAKDENGKPSEIRTNPLPELDGYEPIENPDEPKISICLPNSPPKPIHYDGYEEYTPSVEKASLTSLTTTVVRRVTDELPDLPKPKRNLPKSPRPCRSAPKPPIFRLESTEEESPTNVCQEPHYYGGEENIYDTIKGSHCYESLQSVGSKLRNSPPLIRAKNSDCLSLSSNCYEIISQYKRTNTVSQHSGGSSNGSTLTISSENKTNSLYEDSLNSSLHYASKRIYNMTTNTTHIHINKISGDVNAVNGYSGSIGRRSDTSDEWTDVSDNESGDAEDKPQFIIVRERSKAHKSPDWSKRVRDKRQRKSKSCIEDDDPDHFYEQLSPLSLSKRHSLLEQTRTNSLQRNEDSVRVSKRGKQMSYSAHALGQHISDDSFDSDTDDYYESGHFKNAHNDSGVDIRNTKLPDPPTSSNQMYSFVKKFKNFIVNKKSPNSSKHSGSQQKIYDSSSQFYSSGQYEEKSQPTASSLQVPETKELSTSEKNLILAQTTMVSTQHPLDNATAPRKSKSGKSLRSRLRKSLVGFDSKQLSTLTPTRSTFYIEDLANEEINEQLDSGFSEKTLSGELPTSTPAPSAESQKLSTLIRKSKKEAKLNNSQRRRTTIGLRPHEPPPPPPPDNNSKPRRQSNTSWYAECGVFKNGTTNLVHDECHLINEQNNSSVGSFATGSTWYEEAGLYQTSGTSVASSSGSSGVSTSNEAGPPDEMSHSMFSNEPLYQIYSAAKLEAISRDMHDESSTDGYEEIGERAKNEISTEGTRKSSRPSALQLVEPKSGPERTLWSQIPEVINSYIIPTMTTRERALMEAKFEIITSEASYLKSLNLLRTHYMNHPVFRDQNVVSSRDRKSLFAHIVPVHECSEKLLTELESCWQDNVMLIGLSKRIYAVAEKNFHVYVGFCEHQGRMDRTLKHLREGKGLFAQNLDLLESSPACCGLNLHSFLMLPMQRITRLPLLIDAVFSKCHPNDDEYENWKMCLAIMNKIVTQCNEAANKSEQAFEIERISRQLEFNPSVIRPLAIAPAGVLAPGTKPRYLVKKGELTHLIWRGDDAKLTFGKKFSKSTVFAFLFSDLLVLTKRKAEEQFSVFDYCPRNMLTITSGDSLPQLPTKDLNSQTSKNLILMTLLENHERKTVELLLSCPSVSEQERWLQAMRPPESETPGEKLYEQWDCPQVIAKHAYENNEPDVLNLDLGDVVNVTRKLPDGWYKGERIRDGAVGWFPGSYTEEVNSVHVRARNLKQRHRLLTFTATYLESQKRNK